MGSRLRQWNAWQSVGSLILAIWFAAWPFASFAQTPAATPPPPDLGPVIMPVPGSLGISSAVTPGGALLPGQEGRVSLSMFGQASADCFGLPVKPIDVVVVIDTSPSAGRPAPGSNFDRAQTILRSLWAQIDQPLYRTADASPALSRLAIVTVDAGVITPDEVNVRLPFTTTTSAIDAAITGLQNGADSGFDKGIRQATKLLAEQGRPDAAHVMVVLLHDNYFALQKVVQTEAAAARSKAQVFVIGNRLNVREAEQLTTEASSVLAGSSERVYLDPSAADLRRLFVAAAEGNPGVFGRVFSVREEFTDPAVVEIDDVANGGKLEGNRLVWNSDALLSSPLDLSYSFRLASSAGPSFETAVGVTFVDCNGFPHLYLDDDGKVIGTPIARRTVEVATPTTAAARAITETPKPDVRPTATPTAIILPPVRCTLSIGSFRVPCWLIGLLALLLLLALFLLIRSLRRGKEEPKPPEKPGPATTAPLSPTGNLRPRPALQGQVVTPGRAPDDAALRQALLAASSFSGRVPIQQLGPARGRVALRVFRSPEELAGPGGLNLRDMGELFKWRQGGAEDKDVPTRLVQQVLSERVSKETPLIAGWTQEPADNAEIELQHRIDPVGRRIVVWATSRYRPPAASQSQMERAYWLELRFLENPGYDISVQSVNEG